MNVLLVNPINRSYIIMPSLGLGYLASRIRRQGHTVNILHCLKERMGFDDFRSYLEQTHFDVIGFQMYSYDLIPVKKHIDIIKSANPSTITVAGGPHPSGAPEQTMEYLSRLDYAFKGEAEIGFPLLLDRLEDNPRSPRDLSSVPGLIRRRENGVTVNQPRYITNLDDLEFPSWDLLKPETFQEAFHGAFARYFPAAPIIISRGCPFRCTFCAGKAISGPRLRFRSVDNVIEEILYLADNFGIREFLIEDENLTFNKKLTAEFCEKLLNSPLKNPSWSCPSGVRLDTLDSEILKLMERAGCYSLAMGIEFGTQKMLDLTNKGITLEMIEEKIALLAATRIKTTGFFMLGVPGETLGDIQETVKLALRLKLDRAQFNNFMPLPGSELAERLQQANALGNLDWSKMFVHNVSFEIPGVGRKKLKNLQRTAYLRFYLRPKVFINILKEIKSFRHLRYLLRRIHDAIFYASQPKD